ncbi:MAG: PqqD family protein [Armatimonadota bacterium]
MNAEKTMRAGDWATDATIVPPPRRNDVIEEELDGEAVLFDPRSGNTYRLNQTAFAVWRQCNGLASTREIAEQLTQAYEVELEAALDHVEQLVALFGQSKLLDVPSER